MNIVVEEHFLTVDEVAEKLGLSGATVRRMVRNQEIGAMKVGKRQYRIASTALAEYISANTTARKPAAPQVPE
jgi:excisionase family DNA binding protein